MIRGGRGPRIPFRRIPLNNTVDNHGQPPALTIVHEPTPKECAEVKQFLGKVTNFPLEVVDIVMDFAEYWTCSVAAIDYSVTKTGQFAVSGGNTTDRENQFILRTEPLGLTTWHTKDKDRWLAEAPAQGLVEEYPREELERFVEGPPSALEHPFRKIVFDIVSQDQGYTHDAETRHTFRASWTWFDAGIDRFDKRPTPSSGDAESETSESSEKGPSTHAIRPIWPPLKEDLSGYNHQLHATADHMIQCNRVAAHEWQHHHVEWSWTDNIDPESQAGRELEENGRGSATGDGSFLRSLKVGDMLTVWARARFPGWLNRIQKVEVRVYWAL